MRHALRFLVTTLACSVPLGWVLMMADEPPSQSRPVLVPPAAVSEQDNADRLKHWAFVPARVRPLPQTVYQEQALTWVDPFVLNRLEQQGLKPALQADKPTLLRRVSYNLLGLPPTLGDLQETLADETPDAFERIVDRYLAAPAFGVRWARHWLDVARYADARDLIQLPAESDFREVRRYRDWVVAAMNRDLPYRDFIKLQFAGDLLQPATENAIDAEALIATGLLALADFVPGDVDKEQMIADYVNDEIELLGRAFLGLTVACARCHDHKFDPITSDDYYALAGIFFSTRLIPGPIKGNTPLIRRPLLSVSEIAEI